MTLRRYQNLRIIKCAMIALLLLGMVLMPYTICKAASASITLSTDKTSVTTGEEVTVSLHLSSEALIGDFEAYITYNDDVLEYKDDSSRIAGGDGLLKISDKNVSGEDSSRKYVITFQAIKVGNSEISMKEKPNVYEYDSGMEMSVSTNHISIYVSAEKTASSNTELKSLKINPGTLTPKFRSDITEYTTQADKYTDKIIISAVAEDDSAVIELKGNDKIVDGSNEITITVKAKSGHKKIYTIKAVKEKQESDNTLEETIEETLESVEEGFVEEFILNSNIVEINEIAAISSEDGIYLQNGFRYQIVPIGDETILPKGYVKTTLVINEVVIDAYTPQSNLESDYLLLYARNEDGDVGFYQYDRIENTMQRFNPKISADTNNKLVMTNEILHSEDYKKRITTMGILIAILGAIIISMSLALLHVYMKSRDPKE